MTRSKDELSTIRSEGALLPPDFLSLFLDRSPAVDGLSADDYKKPGQRLDDVIAREWAALLGTYAAFQKKLATRPTSDHATALTRQAWLVPLFESLGFGQLSALPEPLQVGDRVFAVSHRWQHAPIHAVGHGVDLDKRTKGAPGAETASPHALVQTLLNQHEGSLWGIVTNGQTLRLLRDNQSLSRQAFIDFDLAAILDGQRFSDFRLFWLVCHASRFASERKLDQEPSDCWLEKWRQAAQTRGVQALDRLRDGVKKAIERLGNGFFRHPASAALQARLRDRQLSKEDYYRDLLRLVYRLIFVLVAEERGVLLSPDATPAVRALYQQHYALGALRDRALRGRGGPHADLWCQLREVLFRLHDGCPELALPALGSFLFRIQEADEKTGQKADWLRSVSVSNDDLLGAFQELCYVTEKGRLRRVRWQDVGADELGSVYEALLELQPRFEADERTFVLGVVAGNERKTSGSYYTPSSLVDCLLDSALDPVIDQACRDSAGKLKSVEAAKAALLDLKVCDPACGSGHFLVAAARRIARRYAEITTNEDEPSPEALRHALREVTGKCLYGVDINPMAVELCKVSLWMEALEPGRPLSFLEHRIQCGNSLLGVTPKLLAGGIPDEAFAPLEGDDKKITSALKKQNKKERETGQRVFNFDDDVTTLTSVFATAVKQLDQRDDTSLAGVASKEEDWQKFRQSAAYQHALLTADAWCAAFVWPKSAGSPQAVTDAVFRDLLDHTASLPSATEGEVRQLSKQYQFFHWHLAFPDVFAARKSEKPSEETGWSGGFDCVLGNPPWEHVELKEEEWFAQRRPQVAAAPNASSRKRMITTLRTEDPSLYRDFTNARRAVDGENHLVRSSGRYPLCARGRLNTYALFSEHNRSIVSMGGLAGFIIPTGIATDDNTKDYFSLITSDHELVRFYSFENEDLIFPGVHHAFKFALITLSRDKNMRNSDFVFYSRSTDDISDKNRHFSLGPEDFILLNPNTKTCPTFRSQRDSELNKSIYQRTGVFWKESDLNGNPWGLFFAQGLFNMASDSEIFLSSNDLNSRGWKLTGNVYALERKTALPLFEAKMVHYYDHRFSTYEGASEANIKQGTLPRLDDESHMSPTRLALPEYWVLDSDVNKALADLNVRWLMGWRNICRSVDQRTVICSILPKVAVGHSLPLIFSTANHKETASLYANLTSFVLDYCARLKIGGSNLTYNYLKQFPVLNPTSYLRQTDWDQSNDLLSWILPRVLELTYTAWDLEAFGKDVGYEGPPFRWDPARRFLLRCELDAAFFHLYGIARDDVDYIMETFPIVKRKDVEAHGEYRTKRVILEIYDEMAAAEKSGTPYQTRLEPPPADPRVAHPPRSQEEKS